MAVSRSSLREAPKGRIDPTDPKYSGWRADHRALNALLYLGLAREAVKARDFERACRGYRRSLQTWDYANEVERGRWRLEQDLTNREYAAFLLGEVRSPAE